MKACCILRLSAVCGVFATTLVSNTHDAFAKFIGESVPQESTLVSRQLEYLNDISSDLNHFNKALMKRANAIDSRSNQSAVFSIDRVLISDSKNSQSEPEIESNPSLKLEEQQSSEQPENSDAQLALPPAWVIPSILLLAKRSHCLEEHPHGLNSIQDQSTPRPILAIAFNTCLNEISSCSTTKKDQKMIEALEAELSTELKLLRDRNRGYYYDPKLDTVVITNTVPTIAEQMFSKTTKLSGDTVSLTTRKIIKPQISEAAKTCH